jgi:hypothetical protein
VDVVLPTVRVPATTAELFSEIAPESTVKETVFALTLKFELVEFEYAFKTYAEPFEPA